MTRLTQRIHRLEAQRRPAHVTAVLRRERACSPADLRAVLLGELTTVDLATCAAIMEQLPDAALDAIVGPEAARLLDTLPDAELEALTRGDPAADYWEEDPRGEQNSQRYGRWHR